MRLVKERREGSRDQDGRTRPGFTGHPATCELLCAENRAGTCTALKTNNRTARGKGTRRRRGRRHLPSAGPLARASAEPPHGQPSTPGPHRPHRGPLPAPSSLHPGPAGSPQPGAPSAQPHPARTWQRRRRPQRRCLAPAHRDPGPAPRSSGGSAATRAGSPAPGARRNL